MRASRARQSLAAATLTLMVGAAPTVMGTRPAAAEVISIAQAQPIGECVNNADVIQQIQSGKVVRQQNIEFASPGGSALLMDAYSPSGGRTSFPAVVMIHGGGFNRGDKSQLRGESVWFAEHGYAAFSINYRLAPQFPFPAPINDTQAAVSFIRQNASRFHVDPKRIALLGTSAGGTIALSLGAMSGKGKTGSRVTAVVAWSPPIDLLDIWQTTTDASIQGSITDYLGLPAGQDLNSPSAQALARRASPASMVRRGLPPTFVANSMTEQIALPTAQAFVNKLKELAVSVELLTPPSGHAVAYACDALQPSLDFLNRYIGGSAEGPAPSPGSPTPDQAVSPQGPETHTPAVVQSQPSTHIALVAAGGALAVILAVGLGVLTSRSRRRHGATKPRA